MIDSSGYNLLRVYYVTQKVDGEKEEIGGQEEINALRSGRQEGAGEDEVKDRERGK